MAGGIRRTADGSHVWPITAILAADCFCPRRVFPTSTKFGAGRFVELPNHCRALGMRRPLLVTDAGLAALPMIARAVDLCRKAGLGCEVFSGVQPDPHTRRARAAVRRRAPVLETISGDRLD